MSPIWSDLGVEEYRALRATVRERGTARLFVTTITFVAWGALVVVVHATLAAPVLSIVPLVVLAAGFEVVFAAHVGVERVGRYVQVHYEAPPGELPRWEQVIMRLGRKGLSSGGIDPLFSGVFAAAALVNLAPVALVSFSSGPVLAWGVPLELAVYGLIHLLFIARIVRARRFISVQRARELALFQKDWTRPTDRHGEPE